jgi:plasmid stabilization system protein ParE
MKVIWTSAALVDLDDILAYTAEHYPALGAAVERRIRAVVARIGQWPASARLVEERPDTRVVPLIRYPYRVFYHVRGDTVEILHIHHAAQAEPE